MSFKPGTCSIPSVWCGKGKMPAKTNEKKYTRRGTPLECMKQGYGAGYHSEHSKHLPKSSLQRIKYVGPKMEDRFRENNIKTMGELRTKMKSKSPDAIKTTLGKILKKNDGSLDGRAYNSVLLYLYSQGITNLPQCRKL